PRCRGGCQRRGPVRPSRASLAKLAVLLPKAARREEDRCEQNLVSKEATTGGVMSKRKVLVIGSNASRIEVRGGGPGATGQYLNETVVPAMALVKAGYDVVLATPNGAKPHIDEASDSAQHFGGDEAAYQRARNFFATDPSMNQGRTLRSVID